MSSIFINDVLKRLMNQNVDEKFTTHIMIQIDRLQSLSDIMSKIENFTDSENIINNSRKNYLINLVSFFETWMRRLFIKMIDKYDLNSYRVAEQINRKIKFKDLIEISKTPIGMGELMAEFINFQNLSDIDKFFSAMFNENFLEQIKLTENTGMKPLPDGYYKTIKKGLECRHEIVHNFINNIQISREFIKNFSNIITAFNMCAYGYCYLNLKKKMGYNPDVFMVFMSIFGDFNEDDGLELISHMKEEISNNYENDEDIDKINFYIEKNKPEELENFLEVYLKEHQNDVTAMLYLANLYLLQNKEGEKCEKLHKKALLINPRSSQVWLYYFEFLLFNGKIEPALTSCQRAISFNPESARSWFALSIINIILENKENAKRFLMKTMELISDSDTQLILLARDLIVLKKNYKKLDNINDVISEINHEKLENFIRLIEKVEEKYKELCKKELNLKFLRLF